MDTKNTVMADRHLPLDAFAAMHSQTICDHLARRGQRMDPESAQRVAAELWGYLQRLMVWTD